MRKKRGNEREGERKEEGVETEREKKTNKEEI